MKAQSRQDVFAKAPRNRLAHNIRADSRAKATLANQIGIRTSSAKTLDDNQNDPSASRKYRETAMSADGQTANITCIAAVTASNRPKI